MARSSSTGSTSSRNSRSRPVVVYLVTGICVLGLTIVTKYALDTELDFVSQFAPVWVFIAWLGTSSRRGESRARGSVLSWTLAIVLVTVAVLVIHAV